jgi:hypothetical protein
LPSWVAFCFTLPAPGTDKTYRLSEEADIQLAGEYFQLIVSCGDAHHN